MIRIYNIACRRRIPVCAVALLWLVGIIGFPSAAHSGGVPAPSLAAWLSESPLPPAVQNAFRARFVADPSAHEWLVIQEGQVYALAYQAFSPTTRPAVQQAIRGAVQMKARHLLLLYAAGEHYQQHGFHNREATVKALTAVEATTQGQLLPGVQSRATVLDEGAVALVWIGENRVASYREQLPALEQVRPAYCHALYPTAKALFQESQYHQALNLYKEMHGLRCREPTAYFLDAAECFLAIQQPKDARRMAEYLLSEYAAALSNGDLKRANDLLSAANDAESAQTAFEE